MPSAQPPLLGRNLLLAILSGLLLTLSFSPNAFSLAAWVALVPLLIGIQQASFPNAFRLGLACGMAHCLTLIYWIVVVLKHYGNLNIVVAISALLLLSLYLSLYPAVFALLASRLPNSPAAPFVLACYWVALEFLRTHLMTGFPWCLLGYSQYEQLPMVQTADLFGVYGLSFLIVSVNGLLFRIIALPRDRRTGVLKWEVPIPLLLLAGSWAYGDCRIAHIQADARTAPSVKGAVVQANIDQSLKWDPAYQEETMATYARLTRSTRAFDPDLIVWPETAVPFFFQDHARLSPHIFSLAKESGAVLIFGSPAYERRQGRIRYFNRAYMIVPRSRDIFHYDKIHLVPFGEYVPFQEYLPFIRQLVAAAGNFASGDKLKPLETGDLSAGVLICFEAIFPELARGLSRGGADLFVNITNDAWFGRTSAPFQHLGMAVFRCIENRRPMIRAANTGFSAFIEPTGVIRSRSHLFVETVLTGSVPTGPFPGTVYTRFGDFFAVIALIIATVHVLYGLVIKRRRFTDH